MPRFGKHCFYRRKAFLALDLINLLLIGFVCSVGIDVCSWLRRIFLFKAGVIASFANAIILKIVDSNGLIETMVNYQKCPFISSHLHSFRKLYSLLLCEQRSLHLARWARVC